MQPYSEARKKAFPLNHESLLSSLVEKVTSGEADGAFVGRQSQGRDSGVIWMWSSSSLVLLTDSKTIRKYFSEPQCPYL